MPSQHCHCKGGGLYSRVVEVCSTEKVEAADVSILRDLGATHAAEVGPHSRFLWVGAGLRERDPDCPRIEIPNSRGAITPATALRGAPVFCWHHVNILCDFRRVEVLRFCIMQHIGVDVFMYALVIDIKRDKSFATQYIFFAILVQASPYEVRGDHRIDNCGILFRGILEHQDSILVDFSTIDDHCNVINS